MNITLIGTAFARALPPCRSGALAPKVFAHSDAIGGEALVKTLVKTPVIFDGRNLYETQALFAFTWQH